MAYVIGQGNNIQDLFTAIEKILTDNSWQEIVISKNEKNINDSAVFVGKGSGNDKIYIYFGCHNKNDRLILESMVGYDSNLGIFEQPGSIQQWLKAEGDKLKDIPEFVISNNERFFYWIFVDTYRIIVVARMSIVYESLYLGFVQPIASERQYPYPMYVCGNTHENGQIWPNNQNGSFVFPQSNAGFLRRADGVWRAFDASSPNPDAGSTGTIFPYNSHNEKLISNYKETDEVNQDNFLLMPIMLQTNNPVDINGALRGCYWISGTRDLDAERLLVYNNSQFIVFDTKQARGANTYFAIEMS